MTDVSEAVKPVKGGAEALSFASPAQIMFVYRINVSLDAGEAAHTHTHTLDVLFPLS